MSYVIQKLRLVLQAPVNIDKSEIIGQQMIERRSVFRYLGLVPEVFKGQNTRGITVLGGLRVHRRRQHQSCEQKNPASEPRQASTVVQLVAPPDASYISNRQSARLAKEVHRTLMHHLDHH